MKHSLIKSVIFISIMTVAFASQAQQQMPSTQGQMQQQQPQFPPQGQMQQRPQVQMQQPQFPSQALQQPQLQQQSQPQFQQEQQQPPFQQTESQQQTQPQQQVQQQLQPQQQQPTVAVSGESLQMNWSSLICVQDTPVSLKNYFVRDFEGNVYQMNSQQWDCEKQAGIKKFQPSHCGCVLKTAEVAATGAGAVTVVDNTQQEAQRFDAANAGAFERIGQNMEQRQDGRQDTRDQRQDNRDLRQDLRQDQRQQERR